MLQSDIYLRPLTLSRLNAVKRKVYKFIDTVNLSFYPSTEPISITHAKDLPFTPIKIGAKWAKELYDCAWFKIEGEYSENLKNPVILLQINGEGMVYDEDFTPLSSITSISNKINFFQIHRGKQEISLKTINKKFTLYVDAGFNGVFQAGSSTAKIVKAEICDKNLDYYKMFYNLMTLFSASFVVSDNTRKKEINVSIKNALKYIEEPKTANQLLSKVIDNNGDEDLSYDAVGHGHLDLAWLWPIRETRRKVYRTLIAQLNNLELDDNFVYGISQPQQLSWLKEDNYPLFLKVKEKLLNGRFEPQGGMWVESDCNLPCGESLIRQFYYGLKFWKEEIGVEVNTCWLPDVFGFSPSLPKIIKGCNLDNFMTIKVSWNTVNKFPYNSFNWIGNDGSSVLSHVPPESDYTCTGSPFVLKRGAKRYTEQDKAPLALIAYGVGDGGCGPSSGHIEILKRERNFSGLPKTKFNSADNFFKKLSSYKDSLPNYLGELYLEKHQGTFTSQAKVKLYNRRLESLLHIAEFYMSQLLFNNKNIDKFCLDSIWQEVLLYQFHDIIPGSSIHRVYEECVPRYQALEKQLKQLIEKMSVTLNSKVGLFNPSPTYKEEVVQNGSFIAKAKPYSNAVIEKITQSSLRHDDFIMENKFLKVKFNKNGEIVSLLDSENFETLAKKSNVLRVYTDPFTHFDAWDIFPHYEKLPKWKFKLLSVDYEEKKGEIRRVHVYKFNKSNMVQTVILGENAKYLDFETIIEWNETHKMLRADFYPISYSDEVICDTQFGYKKYKTTENDSFEKAQFEINAHKFIETNKNGRGFALLNNCKYGHRVKNGKMSLNLLRSSVYPDKTADKGSHAFNYAIYPHRGDLIEAKTQDLAYSYNYDFVPFELPNPTTFIEKDNDNIIIETIKPSFDKKGIVIRLYEKSGTTQNCIIKDLGSRELFVCNLLEQNLAITDGNLTFAKFEIKTIYIKI